MNRQSFGKIVQSVPSYPDHPANVELCKLLPVLVYGNAIEFVVCISREHNTQENPRFACSHDLIDSYQQV